MRVNTNVPSLISYNALNATNKALQKAIERLSTGLRINSAADDAAGLAISEKMRAQSRGLDQAVKNAQDGISMIQTAEGAMNEVHSILQRMRELSVQAANDTLTMNDREFVQLEIDQLKEEIDRIAFTTQFNKKKLLDGSSDALWSTDLLGTRVFVNGSMLSRDQFGQVLKFEGNFIISATAAPGQNQVLKSNIFIVSSKSGSGPASVFSSLSNLVGFTTTNNGVNILDDPKSLTVSLEGGGSATIMVYANDTIDTLGDKLNAAIALASGITMDEHVGVQYVSNGGMLAWEDSDESIMKATMNWLQGAAERVYDAYGLVGTGQTLNILLVDDFPGNVGATAQVYGGQGYITLSRDTFAALHDTLDTGIAHELTHVLTFLDPNISNVLNSPDGMWLIEGLAEYTVGTNYKVQSANRAAVENMLSGVSGTLLNPGGAVYDQIYNHGDPNAYAAAYLAVRYFDETSIAYNAGNTAYGIKGLISALSGGANLNTAINTASGGLYTSYAAFVTKISGTFNDYSAGDFGELYNRIMMEDPTVDTGAIGGYYVGIGGYFSGTPLTPTGVVPDYDNYDPDALVGTVAPFSWGNVVWPNSVQGGPMDPLISTSKTKEGELQSVDGTLLLHSNVLGSAGKITISGDEDLIKALGFTEVQSARETVYDINIIDAHTGNVVKSGVRISGNTMYGELHENIDIRMLNNFSLEIDDDALQQDDGYGSYIFSASATLNSFIVHIAENSVALQIGANEREDMFISFGDVTAASLGIEHVSVRDRELAARAVTVIDGAISKVSTKRARLGAYQNRLEHTITNLTATAANMTAAESRIRDADMAKAIIDFTRLNILSQTGNSMLAQANQLPSNILTLLR